MKLQSLVFERHGCDEELLKFLTNAFGKVEDRPNMVNPRRFHRQHRDSIVLLGHLAFRAL